MTKSDYTRELFKYATTNVFAMLGLSLYILSDTYFIARGLGEIGLASLNLAIPMISLIMGFGQLIAMGVGTKYAIHRARGEHHEARVIVTVGLLLILLLSIVLVLAGIYFSDTLALQLGATGDTLPGTTVYVQVSLLFSPAFVLNALMLCLVRNDHRPRLAMVASLAGSFSNIILDYLFIFPLGMGMFGAVLATGFAPVISLLVLSPLVLKKKLQVRIAPSSMDWSRISSIVKLGIPSFVVELSSGLVIMVFNQLLLALSGTVGVAAYGVVANLSIVIISIFNGIAQGMQPITSRAYGLGETSMGIHVLKKALLWTFVLAVTLYGLLLIYAPEIAMLFNSDENPAMQELAVEGLRLYSTGMIAAGLNMVITMYFNSVESTRASHILTFLRGILLILPMAYGLSFLWGTRGVWLSFPATEFSVLLLGIYFYSRMMGRFNES